MQNFVEHLMGHHPLSLLAAMNQGSGSSQAKELI